MLASFAILVVRMLTRRAIFAAHSGASLEEFLKQGAFFADVPTAGYFRIYNRLSLFRSWLTCTLNELEFGPNSDIKPCNERNFSRCKSTMVLRGFELKPSNIVRGHFEVKDHGYNLVVLSEINIFH